MHGSKVSPIDLSTANIYNDFSQKTDRIQTEHLWTQKHSEKRHTSVSGAPLRKPSKVSELKKKISSPHSLLSMVESNGKKFSCSLKSENQRFKISNNNFRNDGIFYK